MSVKVLEKYSIGVGDRFGLQAGAQLKALIKAEERGIHLVPVWNKSHREHHILHTQPVSVRREADQAVRELGWKAYYYVDADHVGADTVESFLACCNYFTLDVGDSIGGAVDPAEVDAVAGELFPGGTLPSIPGLSGKPGGDGSSLRAWIAKYLPAVKEAASLHSRIESAKKGTAFVTEISMDETTEAQTAPELAVILALASREGIPLQVIAPKFTGNFYKGIDYDGDPAAFSQCFSDHLAVIRFAVTAFSLPANLKLSVHSGSDKFSIYPAIRAALKKDNAGVHVKTAGTTWLEEIAGLSISGDRGLKTAKAVYGRAYERFDELCEPYAPVLLIDRKRLPPPGKVESWTAEAFAGAVRHDSRNPLYNPDMRQLLHVAFKIAAEMGDEFLGLIREYEDLIGDQVTDNLYTRHILPLFEGL
ncbi:hypothetical protein JW906_10365 [bacterium]|nr:hypothetical protein [bacterium]